MGWVGRLSNPAEAQDDTQGGGGADTLNGGGGMEAMGFGGQDFESLFQEMMGLMPKTPNRAFGGVDDDAAGGIARGDFAHMGGGEVQRIGDFRASALRGAQKRVIGRDPRSKLTVTVDGMKFFRDHKGNVVPFTQASTDLYTAPGGPVATGLAGDVLPGLSTEEVGAIRPGLSREVGLRGAIIRSEEVTPEGFSDNADPKVLAKARAASTKRAEALLLKEEEREADQMPDALEGALLDGANKLQPGDNPQSMFQAIIQRAGAARTKEDGDRIKESFALALKKAGFLERVEAREERAEDRKLNRDIHAFNKEQVVERKRFERTQNAAQRVVREVQGIQGDLLLDDQGKEDAMENLITRIHGTMSAQDQPIFERMMQRAFGWTPAGAEPLESGAPGPDGDGVGAPETPETGAPADAQADDALVGQSVDQAKTLGGVTAKSAVKTLLGGAGTLQGKSQEDLISALSSLEKKIGSEIGADTSMFTGPFDAFRLAAATGDATAESPSRSRQDHIEANAAELYDTLIEKGMDADQVRRFLQHAMQSMITQFSGGAPGGKAKASAASGRGSSRLIDDLNGASGYMAAGRAKVSWMDANPEWVEAHRHLGVVERDKKMLEFVNSQGE